MGDCGCEKAKADLEEYLHQELTETEAKDIATHLEHCTDCSSEHLVGLVLTEKVKRACSEKAPDDLRAKILRDLEAARA
jgi:anti-sigma factor (TIGR02949 family)